MIGECRMSVIRIKYKRYHYLRLNDLPIVRPTFEVMRIYRYISYNKKDSLDRKMYFKIEWLRWVSRKEYAATYTAASTIDKEILFMYTKAGRLDNKTYRQLRIYHTTAL